jgi:acetyl-CoA carboxylase carboxyltransferase component
VRGFSGATVARYACGGKPPVAGRLECHEQTQLQEDGVSWQAEIDELRRREELGRRMGGEDKIKRHHDGGKLTVRERVAGILDPGSFHEIGAITGKARYDEAGQLVDMVPTNLVMGRGRIDGRPVVITGDDFTVRGGANDGGLREKFERAEMMAWDCACRWCAWSTAPAAAVR